MKIRIAVIFIIIGMIGALLSGCCLFEDSKRYPDVAVGERFNSFGFDGYCRKLPNDYMIEVVFGEGNTVYKINNYDDVLSDAVKIIDNVDCYFCIKDIVFLKYADKHGPIYFSLDTAGVIRQNLTAYADEAELLNAYGMEKIDWIEISPTD